MKGNYAAKICDDLFLNGYNDWYLPSRDELNKLYLNRVVVGGFASSVYWSSSEFKNSNAWHQFFSDGFQNSNHINSIKLRVRAIRAF
jgi:hypothetical protein